MKGVVVSKDVKPIIESYDAAGFLVLQSPRKRTVKVYDVTTDDQGKTCKAMVAVLGPKSENARALRNARSTMIKLTEGRK